MQDIPVLQTCKLEKVCLDFYAGTQTGSSVLIPGLGTILLAQENLCTFTDFIICYLQL